MKGLVPVWVEEKETNKTSTRYGKVWLNVLGHM